MGPWRSQHHHPTLIEGGKDEQHLLLQHIQQAPAAAAPRKPGRLPGSSGQLVVPVHGGHIVRSTGRKDRHSKVCTAKGLRDRRVRLSAQTAIQFYDVQDRLGYDRPSKAVDWLMENAKPAIDELAHLPPFNPTSSIPSSQQSIIEEQLIEPQYVQDLRLSLQSFQEHNPNPGMFTPAAVHLGYEANPVINHWSDAMMMLGPSQFYAQREPLQSSNDDDDDSTARQMQQHSLFSGYGFRFTGTDQ